MPEYAIGLDLGGTNLRAAAIDSNGRVLDKVSGSSRLPGGREALFNDMASAIETLRERQGREGLSGIGVAVPGFILLKEGVVKNSHNIPAAMTSKSAGVRKSFWRTTPMPQLWARSGWALAAMSTISSFLRWEPVS